MNVWIKNSSWRVVVIEEEIPLAESIFHVYHDLSDEDRDIVHITDMYISSVIVREKFLDKYHRADKALADFYLTVLRS